MCFGFFVKIVFVVLIVWVKFFIGKFVSFCNFIKFGVIKLVFVIVLLCKNFVILGVII